MEFYRYDLIARTDHLGLPDPSIILSTFIMEKETPCGYWIKDKYSTLPTWVSKTAKKRYAYPSKEEAEFSFKRRTARRIVILKHQIDNCKMALNILDNTPTI